MELDVYKDWLGIPDGPRPPDQYELLRLVRFEDSTDRIRANYKKLNAHVRKYATGQYSVISQNLLNETNVSKVYPCHTFKAFWIPKLPVIRALFSFKRL